MRRVAPVALLLLLCCAANAAAQDAPHVAIVPVPSEGVGPDVGRPVLEAVRAALAVAAPAARFQVAGDEALVAAVAACEDAACRAPLAGRAGGYAVVWVDLTLMPQGAIQVHVEAMTPDGAALGEPVEVQLPAATAANPSAGQAVLGALLPPLASAIPAAPPAAPATARVLLAVNADRAEVTVDGESAGQTPIAPLQLEVGTHAVSVRATGFEPWARSVEVPAEGVRLDVYLEPTADQAAQLAQRDAADADAYGDAAPKGEWYEQWWVWVAAGAGAVVLTAAIVGIALALGGDEEQEGFPVPVIPMGDM